jgi:hypothetical protein
MKGGEVYEETGKHGIGFDVFGRVFNRVRGSATVPDMRCRDPTHGRNEAFSKRVCTLVTEFCFISFKPIISKPVLLCVPSIQSESSVIIRFLLVKILLTDF